MAKTLIIVGAGAGGGSVAAEVKRKDPGMEITLIEQESHVATAA